MQKEKEMILNMLENGKITAKEAMKLLNAIDQNKKSDERPPFAQKKQAPCFMEGLSNMVKDVVKAAVDASQSLGFSVNVNSIFDEKKLIASYKKDIDEDINKIKLDVLESNIKIVSKEEPYIKIKTTEKFSDEEFKKIFSYDENDGTLTIRQLNNFDNPKETGYRSLIEVSIPMKSSFESVNASSKFGDIFLEGLMTNDILVFSRSGDITLTSSNLNNFEATASSGDIKISNSNIKGDPVLKTNAGDIKIIDSLVNDLNALTSAGDIKFHGTSFINVNLETKAGDIKASIFDNRAENMNLSTTAGDIKINTQNSLKTINADIIFNKNISSVSFGTEFTEESSAPGYKKIVKAGTPDIINLKIEGNVGDIKLK